MNSLAWQECQVCVHESVSAEYKVGGLGGEVKNEEEKI